MKTIEIDDNLAQALEDVFHEKEDGTGVTTFSDVIGVLWDTTMNTLPRVVAERDALRKVAKAAQEHLDDCCLSTGITPSYLALEQALKEMPK